MNGFTLHKGGYYPMPVWEWNLPAGWSCPCAAECLVKVDRATGRFSNESKGFRCYAAGAERFPGVRARRWANFECAKRGGFIMPPANATHVRIHASGDFFSQEYFDQWLRVCRANPKIIFWAFTKSIPFCVKRLNEIPGNLTITASYGGAFDSMIEIYGLKYCRVFPNEKAARASGLPIDRDDTLAMSGGFSFALVDRFAKKAKKKWPRRVSKAYAEAMVELAIIRGENRKAMLGMPKNKKERT